MARRDLVAQKEFSIRSETVNISALYPNFKWNSNRVLTEDDFPSPVTAGDGGMLVSDGTGWVALPPGTNGQLLTIDADVPMWDDIPLVPDATVAGVGGMIASDGSAWVDTGSGTTGQLLVGVTGALPVWTDSANVYETAYPTGIPLEPDVGVITTLTVRGVVSASNFYNGIECIKLGRIVTCTFPSWVVTASTLTPVAAIAIGIIPVGFRPAYDVIMPLTMWSSGAFVNVDNCHILVQPDGDIEFVRDSNTFADPWGLEGDLVLTWVTP